MKKILMGLGLVFGLVSGGILLLALGPDRDLHFVREVTSPLPPAQLSVRLQDPTDWPGWFFDLKKVEYVGSSLLLLKYDSGKTPWSAMQLQAEVIEKSPNRLVLRILEDSSGRLTHHLQNLQWEISLSPSAQGVLVRGSARARTRSWRARILGFFMERILMNQAFHPDLLALVRPPATR